MDVRDYPSTQVVRAALEAHEIGYRIIASWINEEIKKCASGKAKRLARNAKVRVEADPPPPNASFEQSQNQLANALLGIRPFLPHLPRDDRDVCPWVIGYLGRSGERTNEGEKVLIKVPVVAMPMGFGLQRDIRRRVSVFAYDWNEGEWRTYVKEPVEAWFKQTQAELLALLGPMGRTKSRRGGKPKRYADLEDVIRSACPNLYPTREKADAIASSYNQKFGHKGQRALIDGTKVLAVAKEMRRPRRKRTNAKSKKSMQGK